MIWIVTKKLIRNNEELIKRHEYISDIARCEVTPWEEYASAIKIPFFRCVSRKGEYGIFISAHMISEVPALLEAFIPRKRTVVVVNSCGVEQTEIEKCVSIVKQRNNQSLVYWSKQEHRDGIMVSYMDDVGTFGFPTTISERELFQNRHFGLITGIKMSFERKDVGG